MTSYLYGIDIGGTAIKIGLFDREAKMLHKEEIPTNTSSNGSHILSDIVNRIKEINKSKNISQDQIKGIGLGIPGLVDSEGYVSRCINLGWTNISVKDKLEHLSGYPVAVANDANAAAVGEWFFRKKQFHNLVLITLGTGVGGGVIINDHLVTGAFGAGGEFGHIHVDDFEKTPCGCGRCGCLEQYASATALVNRVIKEKALNTVLYRDNKEITSKSIFDAAKQGDKYCIEVVDDFCRKLAVAMTNISCIIAPDIFLIGGGVSRTGDFLLDKIRQYYYESCYSACKKTVIELAKLKNDAGMFGAACIVKENENSIIM